MNPELYKCEICQSPLEAYYSLCNDCDKLVEDWDEETDSYRRKDGKGTYKFNRKSGLYELVEGDGEKMKAGEGKECKSCGYDIETEVIGDYCISCLHHQTEYGFTYPISEYSYRKLEMNGVDRFRKIGLERKEWLAYYDNLIDVALITGNKEDFMTYSELKSKILKSKEGTV